jgi:tetratricopeptide (TPR) repeat protein
MSLFRSLRRLLRLPGRRTEPPAPPAPAVAPDLRRRVEEAVAADDADALAALLRPRREEGKALIRQYRDEIAAAEGDPERRLQTARRAAALVTLYDRAFDDREPLAWFRPAGASGTGPDGPSPVLRLREAQEAFARADFEGAEKIAAEGLEQVPGDATGDAAAVRSTLLAVRGAVAVRTERWGDARRRFDESLVSARASGHRDALAAALLNLIDLHTRRDAHDEAAGLLDEACRATPETPYEDVLGKLLVERGVALTHAGDLPAAIATLDRAVHFRPEWPFPLYQRGWARFLSGDPGGALDDYRECAAIKQVFFTVQREIRCLEDVAAGRLPIEAYRSFCVLRDRTGVEPAQVEESAGRMTEQYPDFAPAHLLRAEARLALRDPDGAREAAREALRHDPDADTAAAALFFDWNVSRLRRDEAAAGAAATRLSGAYADHPAAMIVEKVRTAPRGNLALRWTFAMDGTLRLEEIDPDDLSSPGRTPPSSGPPR